MTILLFGVSNVGKSTIGELLAHKLNFDFYDLDNDKHLEIVLLVKNLIM